MIINNPWSIQLNVEKGFCVNIEDNNTASIIGVFDEDQIAFMITEKLDPEYLYLNGELEAWAENHGYVLDNE